MLNKLKSILQHQFHHPNYLLFMLSLFLMILAPPLAEFFEYGGRLFMNVTFLLVTLMAVFYTSSGWLDFWILLVVGTIMYWTFLSGNEALRLINVGSFLVFFTMVFIELMTYILRSKEIKANDIFACMAGFIIMGVMATPVFTLLHENINGGAFTIPQEGANFYDFLYFSLITLTSVGFGDISPTHNMARAITLILAIVGQMYMAILVAIIIGKYMAREGE